MKVRSSRFEIGAEVALALLGLHVVILAVFRRYSLAGLGIPLSARDPTVALILIFLLLAFRVWLNRRRDPPEPFGWPKRAKPGNWLADLGTPGLVLVGFFLFTYYLFHQYGGRLGGDGVINYIYVRSLIIDGDFNLTNEFVDFVPDRFQYIADQARGFGKPPDPSHEPGPAFLWAPAFLLTHGIVIIARQLGADIAADGYSYPYINTVCLSGFLWGFVAVLLSYRVCRRYVAPHLAAVSIGVLWLSSTLFWYTVMEPSMPHATATAAVSVFLFLWLKVRDSPTVLRWIGLGLVGGAVLSMQRYNVFYLLAPLATASGELWRRLRRGDRKELRRALTASALVVAAFVLTALPMLLYNLYYARDGSLLRVGDLGGFTLRYWNNPQIGKFLFSSKHGLFAWTPVAYLAVIGLFLFLKKDKRLAATLLVTLAGGIYLLSSTWDWYAGFAFGSRRLTEGFLIFALGFCCFNEFALRKPKILAAAALALLVGWNFLLASQVKRGEVPMMGTFAFSDAAARSMERLYSIVGHPSSIPASWFFGWRYGVSPAQFDPTYGHRPYHNLTIDVGGKKDRYFLGRGWSLPEVASNGASYRWSVGSQSTWLVPLFGPFDYRLRLTGEPSRHPEGWRQTLSIEVNGRRASSITTSRGWQTVETKIPASFWREGLNEVLFRYGWTVEAESVYGGSDDRQIAFRLEQLDLEIVK